MFLNGSFLGYSAFESSTIMNKNLNYSHLTIKGNVVIDKIHIQNKILTIEEINNITLENYAPEWGAETIFLANFNNSLNAGNVNNITAPIISWKIARQEIGKTNLEILDIISVDNTSFNDIYAIKNKEYKYFVFPITQNEIGESFESNNVTNDYYGWFLIGTNPRNSEETLIYKFDLEVQTNDIKKAEDVVEYQTFNRFNTFSRGNRRFDRVNISAILGDIDGTQLQQTVDNLNLFEEFIYSSDKKILKSPKGHMWKVFTQKYGETLVAEWIEEQPYKVSFECVQCEEISL